MPVTVSVRSDSWKLALAVVAIAAFGALALVSPRAADASQCHSLAQNITKLNHVSCKTARKLVNSAYRAGANLPECKGRDSSTHFRGWKFKATSRKIIVIRVTKGNKSFVLSGGGAC